MNKKLKYLITAVLALVLSFGLSVSVSAQEPEAVEVYEDTDGNFFDKLYTEVSEYAGEILCALTFAGSLILAFAYKKGLLPIIKGSLLSIGNAVSKMKDSVSESSEKGAELGKSIENGLNGAVSVLEKLAEKVDALDVALKEKLEDEATVSKEKEAFKLVLSAQIDMLYEIFMSSALPQYQKDAVGERIAKMKGALGENANTD